MADFNLSAEVSMDVDPLKASKTTIERNLKAINKSLRDQRKEMKQNEASAESLAKQETDLGRAIKLQEGLMAQRNKELQDQQKEMKNSNKVTDEQKIKLQNLNAAYEQSKKQLDGYTNEMKGVQVQQKTFGKTTNDVKNNLNDLRNEVKLSQAEFEKSSKATNDYERHINSLTGSLSKSEKQLGQLDDNLKIVSELKGENSREAKALRSEISKEQLAFKQLELQLGKTKTSFNEYQEENSESAIAMRKLDDAIDNTKQSISEMNNSLKLSNAEFNNSSKESDDYKNHLRTLTTTQSKQIQIINELEDEYNQVSISQGKASQQAQDLKNEIAKQNVTFTNLKNQISTTTNEYDDFRLANSETNLTLGEAKRRLEDMNNELKMSSLKFKQSEKTTEDYKNTITQLKTTMTQQGAVITGMNQRYDELKRNKRENSVEAIKLRNDIAKEALAFQVLQGRIDETTEELKEFHRQQRVWNVLGKSINAANEKINRIGDNFRNFGYVAGGVLRGVLIANFSALIPIMGSVISLSAGIGGMLVASAGGAIGMAGAFGIAGIAVKAFAGQATYALQMLEDGQLRVTNEVTAYQTALDGLKSSWEGLIAQNQAAIFNTMTNGINTAKHALTTLNPFLTKTATQIETASGKMLDWAKNSDNAKKAFDILNTQGPKIFQHLLNATQSFVDGSTAMFNKLSPLYGWAAKGFANMAKSFQNWANSVQGSKAINNFVDYTKTNLPIVGSIFGNIFSGIISIFQAFSGHSHNVLVGIKNATQGFKEWSEALKTSDGFKTFVEYLETNGPVVWQLIKNITGTLWGLIKGMSPIGAKVLEMSNAFFQWTNSLTNANPWIGKIVGWLSIFLGLALAIGPPLLIVTTAIKNLSGMLSLAAWAIKGVGVALGILGGPITIAIAAVAAFVGVVVWLWTTNETFRNNILALWNGIRAAAVVIWDAIKFAVQNPMLVLKTVLYSVWTGIKIAAVTLWNSIKASISIIVGTLVGVVKAYFNSLKTFASAVWNSIKNVAIAIWNALKTAVVNIVKALVNGVKWYITTVKTVISTVFNAAKAIAIRIWTAIKNTVVNLAKGLWTGVKNAFNWLKNSVISIFNAIKNFAIKVWTTVKNVVVSRAKALWTGVKNNFNSLKNSVTSIFNAVKNFAIKVWTLMKNRIIANAKLLWNGVRNTFNALKNGVTSIFNAVKNFSLKLWTNLKNGTISRAKALWTGVRNTFNALKKGTTNIFNAVSSYMSNKWNSIKSGTINKAKALWSGVKGAWSNLSKGTRNTMNSVGKFMSSKWSSVKSSTVNKAKDTWSGVRGAWSSLSKGTRNTMNSLGGFMSKKWSSIRNGTVKLVDSLKNRVTGIMSKMGDGIKGTVSKIKGFFTDMIGKVKGGLNKLIDGVNFVGKKLGMGKIDPVNFHTGTTHTQTNLVKNGKISQDTMATVGDKGRGNGPGGFRHETIIPPKGKPFITPNRDTTMPISKGTAIMNGAQTHAMLSNSNPEFASGTIPKFAKGTKKDKNIGDYLNDVKSGTKDKASDAYHGVKDNTQKALEASGKAIGKGKKWLGDAVGDVMDWVDKPGKLFDKIIEGLGLNMSSFGIPKSASLPFDMMKGMFGKLKKSAIDLITGWMEEAAGGEGDAGWLLKHDIWQKFGAYTGGLGFNGGKHYGVDFGMTPGTNVKAVAGGKVSKVWNDYGGGKSMEIDLGGGLTNWYMHLNKQLKKKGDKVGVGDLIAKSGNTGNFTAGSGHLHFQLNKNGKPQANVLEWLKGLGGGGGKKKPSAWGSTIDKAAKKMKVNLSSGQRKGLIAQIARESGGDAGVTQNAALKDGNAGKNLAQGLLQYVPSTFDSFKVKGHGNIKSGYDQLLAFFNNSNWKNDLQYGKSGWGPRGGRRYATGTNNARRGFNQVFEEGGEIMQMRGGETVIPNDVSIQAFKQIASSDIFNRTQTAVYDAISQYADQLREKQQVATREQQELNRLSRENTDIKEQNGLLKQLLGKMDALLNSNQNIETSNQEIRDKNYFPSSREMTKMNNENMALNSATQLMR
ncbi:peptidoglycan DD-metalloendopeptidase family protein [Mammaliicoccus vitulinus]|uniref:peptidoglycan DD-metalloendopeptidase family protein n=1 Tax=Mammaliicoccus vitulinus TaxID=71237 RepID=UPI00248BFE87|nr:peptidoglycan DD-metalloendopeptidase family protein [Mammaliicoccus vitulinus]